MVNEYINKKYLNEHKWIEKLINKWMKKSVKTLKNKKINK